MKIFGIGLNKTGTTTLGICLETLGYRVKGCSLDLTRCAIRGDLASIYKLADQYDGFQDWPWPLIYKELDRHYDDSKFILTTRLDSEAWFRSLEKHAVRTGPTEFRKLIYGHEMPSEHKDSHIKFYEEHNRKVQKYFEQRPGDLLEVCWEAGTGWQELCTFLGHGIPESPIPHANKSPAWSTTQMRRFKGKVKSFLSLI